MRFAFDLVTQLRHEKIPAEIDLSGKKVQHGLQLANQLGAEFALVIGEEELSSKKIKIKHMATRETMECALSELLSKIKALFEKSHV